MQQLQLIINDPCHENWENMTHDQQGRFCNSCAKTVVDFSAMTDGQLINYFKNLKEQNVCGRVSNDQLQRTISLSPPTKKKLFHYWQYALTLFLMFGKTPQAKAQGGAKAKLTHFANSKKVLSANVLKPVIITGPGNMPLAGVSVSFSTGENIAVNDSTGTIYLDEKDMQKTIVISAIGFNEKTIAVKDIQYGVIKMDENMKLLEEVIVSTSETTRCTRITMGGIGSFVTISSTFRDSLPKIFNLIKPSISVYPNPAIRGNSINIALTLKRSGSYRYTIIDATGRLMLTQLYNAVEKRSVLQVNVPAGWSRGTYFIIITGDAGRNIGKEKIIVQ